MEGRQEEDKRGKKNNEPQRLKAAGVLLEVELRGNRLRPVAPLPCAAEQALCVAGYADKLTLCRP